MISPPSRTTQDAQPTGEPAGLVATTRRLLDALNWRLGLRVDRDGRVPALEPHPDMLSSPADGPETGGSQRLRLPEEILHRALAGKVLGGWLQNRHQVLVPLTLRLGQVRADDVETLMRLAAASLLAASPADPEARSVVTRWLRSIGASEGAMTVFERALAAPTALSTLLDRVTERHLEAYAYAIATMAADLRAVSGRLYADFVAARLALPADAVRSINRRYRR